MAQRAAKAAVVSLVAVQLRLFQPFVVDGNIPEHGASTLFNELVVTLGAGDGNFAAPAGHPQLLPALWAAEVAVLLALLKAQDVPVGPVHDSVLQGEVF